MSDERERRESDDEKSNTPEPEKEVEQKVNESPSDDDEGRQTFSESIEISSRVVNRLMSSAGTDVRQLERDSNAQIYIINTGGEAGDTTTINLSGTTNERSRAKFLIDNLIQRLIHVDLANVHTLEDELDDEDDGNNVPNGADDGSVMILNHEICSNGIAGTEEDGYGDDEDDDPIAKKGQ